MVRPVLNRPGRVVVYASTLSPPELVEIEQDVEVSQHEYAIPQLDTVCTLVCVDGRLR